MARVTGIGGFFFRADDPDALNRWYAEQLGVVELESKDYDDDGWFQDRGETVISAFSRDSGGLSRRREQPWAINFRVDDLDWMVARLRGSGIEVEVHDEEYPNGRFAELADPEGNGIQLWEPNAASIVGRWTPAPLYLGCCLRGGRRREPATLLSSNCSSWVSIVSSFSAV